MSSWLDHDFRTRVHAHPRPTNIVGNCVTIELFGATPCDGVGLVEDLQCFGGGAEGKEEVVMQMVGFAAVSRDTVDVGAREEAARYRDAGFFEHLAGGGCFDGGVAGFHVASGEQPAVEAPVMEDQDPAAVGGEHEAGGRDMAGSELAAR